MKSVLAQDEWTTIQQEIWRTVEKYTEFILKGDVEHFLEFFHEKYSGWNNYDLFPVSKNDIKNELLYLPKREINSYEITPLSVNIFNDIAIVHYYYSVDYKSKKGIRKTKNGRNTDILLKHNKNWQLVADHVGVTAGVAEQLS